MSRQKAEVYPSDLSDEQWELIAPVLYAAVGRDGRISRRKRQEHGKRGPRGYDGAKKLCGRKRMTLCDAGGNWLESLVVPANTGKRAGALLLFEKVKASWWSGKLTLIWADEGFGGVDFETTFSSSSAGR